MTFAITAVKAIVRSTATVVLEEAGTRIMGPTTWKYARAIVAPVYDELEKRYPEMRLANTPAAYVAAERAASSLDTDVELRKVLLEGFAALDAGQRQELIVLGRIEQKVEGMRAELSRQSGLLADLANQDKALVGEVRRLMDAKQTEDAEAKRKAALESIRQRLIEAIRELER